MLVVDDWQNLGLGSILTDYCLEICVLWGVLRVWAETTTNNGSVMRILKKRGFEITEPREGEVVARKQLAEVDSPAN